MFVAAFDDRPVTPEYIYSFIRNTTAFCDLNYFTPAQDIATNVKLDSSRSKYKLTTIDPDSLPQYRHVKQLFDDLYVNYSTNPDFFERPCFHRWFALNAATTSLDNNDYICLLDTDFLIGMHPSEVLSQCLLSAENKELQLIADWQFPSTMDREIPIDLMPHIYSEIIYPKAIPPHIIIMTKTFLYDFCKFILTTYYSLGMKDQLVGYYFDAIGNGRIGGISDMTAIATYSMQNHYSYTFNIKNLDSFEIIGNFYSFFYSETGQSDNWKILFQSDGQELQIAGKSKKLIGVHFQGSAKTFMSLAYDSSGTDGVISRAICDQHLEILAKREAKRAQMESIAIANAAKPRIYRMANKLKRKLSQSIRENK
jgi:hypothetical protein